MKLEKDKYHMTSLIREIKHKTEMSLPVKPKSRLREDLWLPRGWGFGENWEFGVSR